MSAPAITDDLAGLCESTFRAMVRCAPLGIFHADADGRILHVNPVTNRIFGTRNDEAIGLGWVANVHPEDVELLQSALAGAADARQECKHEFRLLMPDASTRWLCCRTAPLLSSSGESLGTVGTVEDITAQRATESQLVQAQKMQAIGRLAGGIAHDFNNVLVSIVCSAEFLQADLPFGDSRRADVEEILTGARRAANLTRQLLAIGRKQMLAPAALELNSVVTETEALLRPLLGEAIHIMALPTAMPVLVYADRAQIEQVLMNLAVNARDAMPDGGTFTFEIGTQAADTAGHGWGVMRVSDTGAGMSADVLSHAFEPFFTTKGVGLGAGLGLSTVEGIIRQSGGTITATSEPGEGTTFTIRLPLVEQLSPAQGVPTINGMNGDHAIISPTPHFTPPSSHVGLEESAGTVLVVEDEAAVRAIARRVLIRQGYHVLTARHGGDALRTLTTFKGAIDLLITDVVMPELGGLELASQVSQRFPGLRVVLMSGYADLELDARETRGIVCGFLQKPFTAASLLAAVRSVAKTPA